jgi:hypothetical protein
MAIQNVNLPQGSGIPAVGTLLAMGNNGSPLVYNPVGNQGNIKNAFKAETADTTNQGVIWRQMIATLLDAGKMDVMIHFIPDSVGRDNASGLLGHSLVSPGALGDVFRRQELRPWKLTYPDGSGFYFEAFIVDFPIEADLTKDLILNMGLQMSGEPVPF